MWYVVVYDLENLKNEEAMTRAGSQRHRKKVAVGLFLIPVFRYFLTSVIPPDLRNHLYLSTDSQRLTKDEKKQKSLLFFILSLNN